MFIKVSSKRPRKTVNNNLGKVLVTGGCGFIGSHLCKELVSRGIKIVVVDDLSCGDRKRIQSFEKFGQIKFYNTNICDVSGIDEIFEKEKPTAVVHLAGKISVRESKINPSAYFETNVFGTYNLVEIAARRDATKFIYVNSASSYGTITNVPTDETVICRPTNPYSISKLLGEQVALNVGSFGNIDVISIRLFNLYGIYAGALFGLFIEQIKGANPLTITGDGTQRRDFTFVGDVSHSICELLNSEIKNEIFNVATGQTQSIIDLAVAMGAKWEFIERDADEPDLMWADISKLRQMLPSAVPKSPFRETVKSIMESIS